MEEIVKKMDYYMADASKVRRRREGFSGQHLVVLPHPQILAIARDPLLHDLFPTAAGRFPRAAGHFVQRRTGIDDFILIHVLTGRGWVEARQRRELVAGQFFLIPPGVPHAYGADDEDPWAVEWVHFQGSSAAGFAELFEAEPDSISIHEARVERVDFSVVYEVLESGYTRRNLLAAAARLRLILTELHLLAENSTPSNASEAIRESLAWMKQNLDACTTLPELARAAGLSVPHFGVLFRRATGFPPMEHFLRLKIQRACQLLDTTEMRVGEIAAALSWEDPYYFSRVFRRITGKSPRAYREVAKG